VADLAADNVDRDAGVVEFAELAGARTIISVPMLKESDLVGVIIIYRQEVRPFTDTQIELVSNFARQAVIAIENTRLLNELRQRTDDLSESLEQQTATSEVLCVISSSPGELEPVFQSMLGNATRLCEADSASLILREGSDLRVVARYNAPAALLQQMERDPIFRPGPASGLGRSIRLKQVVQVPDIVNDQAYFDREPARVRGVEAGYRSQLSLPLIKDNEAIGAFNILRRKTVYSRKSRSSLSAISQGSQSLPSRILACSTSCANRCSSRRPPPTCSRSSAARPSTSRRCFKRWSNRPHDCVKPIKQPSHGRSEGSSFAQRPMVSLLNLWISSGTYPLGQNVGRFTGGHCSRARLVTSRMC